MVCWPRGLPLLGVPLERVDRGVDTGSGEKQVEPLKQNRREALSQPQLTVSWAPDTALGAQRASPSAVLKQPGEPGGADPFSVEKMEPQ